MKKIIATVALLAMMFHAFAQTAQELKAERAVLKSELTSKDAKKLDKAWMDLSQKETPSVSGVNSIDALVDINKSLLATLIATENILGQYKISITESKDGEVEINKYTAKLNDYLAQLPLLVKAGTDAAQAAQKIEEVKNDVKSLNPAAAMPAIKAGNWAVKATEVNVKMIERDTKLLNNLINSCKATKNL